MEIISDEYEQCICCKEVSARRVFDLPFQGLVNGEQVSFRGPGWRCEKCKEVWATGEDMDAHDSLKAEAYRLKS